MRLFFAWLIAGLFLAAFLLGPGIAWALTGEWRWAASLYGGYTLGGLIVFAAETIAES